MYHQKDMEASEENMYVDAGAQGVKYCALALSEVFNMSDRWPLYGYSQRQSGTAHTKTHTRT